MGYSSEADVRAQSPFKDSTLINSAYVVQKIAEADAIINGTIGGTYTLPLSSTPDIIVDLSKEIATLLIFREQNKNIEVQPGMDLYKAWEVQMALLQAIASRTQKLFSSAGVELPLSAAALPYGFPNSSDPDAGPAFTRNQRF